MSGKRVFQGAALVVVILALIGLTIASYRGAFESGVPVTLKVERAGSQLNERSDVKVRGLIVGKVTSITTTGVADGADVQLLLDPTLADQVPAGVSAQLLPKTLFGEKFVQLVYPDGVTPGAITDPIQPGAVIPLDRSTAAIELDRTLDSLLPLLQAVEPQKISTTLSSVSMALDGRGERLGNTLVRLQGLLNDFNPALPDLQGNIRELADFSGNLADTAPDLLDAAESFAVPSRTIVEKRDDLRDLLNGLTGGSDDLRDFLEDNGENIIDLADSAKPTLQSLARYSPEFPCLFKYLAEGVEQVNDAIRPDSAFPGVNITLELVSSRGKYIPNQDEPEYNDDRGPRCYPQLVNLPQYPSDGAFRDGSIHPKAPPTQPMGPPAMFGVDDFGTFDGTNSFCDPDVYADAANVPAAVCAQTFASMGIANAASEQQMVAELMGLATGASPTEIPSWSTVLVGPLLRGNEVSFT